MQKVVPFNTIDDAQLTLDNGGRFYNLFTKAGDGVITTAELGKVAGLYTDKQKMVIYLAMCLAEMEAKSAAQVIASLSPDLQLAYGQYLPQTLTAAQAKISGAIASSAIITGIPVLVESKSDFNGFIIVPISTGKSMSMILIPIIDRYDVYQIRDEATSEVFFIAHAKGDVKLPEQRIKTGGIIKELTVKKNGAETQTKFLEALYYADTQ